MYDVLALRVSYLLIPAGMLERIDKGASKKFSIEIKSIGNEDYFELDQKVIGQWFVPTIT